MTLTTYDVTKWEHVEDEQQRTKHQTLGDASGQRSGGGGAVVVCSRDMTFGFQAGEKNGVVDDVESCSEMEEEKRYNGGEQRASTGEMYTVICE